MHLSITDSFNIGYIILVQSQNRTSSVSSDVVLFLKELGKVHPFSKKIYCVALFTLNDSNHLDVSGLWSSILRSYVARVEVCGLYFIDNIVCRFG